MKDYAWTIEDKKIHFCRSCERERYTYGERIEDASTNNKPLIKVCCCHCNHVMYTVDNTGIRTGEHIAERYRRFQ